MSFNLDKEIELIRSNAMQSKELDIVDEDFMNFCNICSEIEREAYRISSIPLPEIHTRVIPKAVENSEILYTDLIRNDGRDFINELYNKLLGRTPDDAGMEYYLGLIETGKATKDDIICYIGLSDEAIEKKTKIIGLNVQRIDPALLMRLDDEAFVRNIYLWILGRDVDREGLVNNLQSLQHGEYKGILLYNIKNSDEGRGRRIEIIGIEDIYKKLILRKRIKNIPGIKQVLKIRRNARINSKESIRKEIENQNKKIDSLTNQFASAIATMAQVSDRIDYLNNAVGEIKNIQIGEAKDLEKKCLHLKQSLMDIKTKCAETEIGLNSVKTNPDFEHNMGRIGEQNEQLITEFEKMRNRNMGVDDELILLKAQLNEIKSDILSSIKDTSNQAFELKNNIEKLTSDYELINHEIVDLKEKSSQIEQNSMQLTQDLQLNCKDIDSSFEQIDIIKKWTDQIGLNVHNNNNILEKLDKAHDDYVRNDKKTLELLEAETSKLKVNIKDLSKIRKENSDCTKISDVHEDSDEYNAIDYFDFENHFRGDREHIKEVQKIYLQYFIGHNNVLDLGCGRGEFTELLTDNGVSVTGVDAYEPYIEYMKMRNLKAVYGDIVEYLQKQNNVGGIFMGQVVEHISIQSIIEICHLAYEKMEEGAYLIMESPNPMSLAIYTECFYMDPSHKKPVHPKTLQYIVRKAGFQDVEIVFTESSKMPYKIPELKGTGDDIIEFNNAMKRVENLLYGSQDYAVIARR